MKIDISKPPQPKGVPLTNIKIGEVFYVYDAYYLCIDQNDLVPTHYGRTVATELIRNKLVYFGSSALLVERVDAEVIIKHI
jgi:hypothetical protein